jgi:hypothetical protein
MPRKNEWAQRYGAKRKAIDRQILAEAEAAIGLEASAEAHTAKTQERPPAVNSVASSELQRWIDREMGEQLAFERQKRESLT